MQKPSLDGLASVSMFGAVPLAGSTLPSVNILEVVRQMNGSGVVSSVTRPAQPALLFKPRLASQYLVHVEAGFVSQFGSLNGSEYIQVAPVTHGVLGVEVVDMVHSEPIAS